MSRAGRRATYSTDEASAALADVLEQRALEVQEAVSVRIEAISDDLDDAGPEYRVGLNASVRAAVEFAAGTLRAGERPPPPMPEPLAHQARLAARHGVGLDAVLRRYIAGRSVIDAFLLDVAHCDPKLPRNAVPSAVSPLGPAFDQLVEYVAQEFHVGSVARAGSSRRRRDRVDRLLSGETSDLGDVRYVLAAYHLAIVSEGGNTALPPELVRHFSGQLLCVELAPDLTCSWLGTKRRVDPVDALQAMDCLWIQRPTIGLGESLEGIDGFRLTHAQARIALAQSRLSSGDMTHYVEVAIAHAVQRDPVLSSTLHRRYMKPLEDERDGGAALRETLRAYLAANRSGVSAAAALGVTRQTVAARLRLVEERLATPLVACATQVELALIAREALRSDLPVR